MTPRRTPALVFILAFLAATPLAAQSDLIKSSASNPTPVKALKPFGPITQINGAQATAQGSAGEIGFELPAGVKDRVKTGQPVWTTMDQKIATFAQFPIAPPKAKNCVGRGPGKGCFRMETSDVLVGNNGKISGKTHLMSEDALAGFTGATWIRVKDRDGNPLATVRGGCYGVNMRQGRTEVWEVAIPQAEAVQAFRAEVFHVNSPCGRDRWEDVLDKAEKGAEVAAKIIEVYAAAKGAK